MDKKLEIILAGKDMTGPAFEKTQDRLASFTKSIFSLRGALTTLAGATAFGAVVKGSLDVADAIAKTADRIGIGTNALQEIRHAAKLSGVEYAELDNSLEAFSKRLGEVRAGTGTLTTFLNKMDSTLLENVRSAGSTDEALQLVFRAMENMTNASDRAALSAAAFGRTAGVNMTTLLRDGTEGLLRMRQEARDLGIVMDEKLLRESEKANDELEKLGRVLKTQVTAAAIGLAPIITDIVSGMTDWIKENQILITQDIPGVLDNICSAAGRLNNTLEAIAGSKAWGKFSEFRELKAAREAEMAEEGRKLAAEMFPGEVASFFQGGGPGLPSGAAGTFAGLTDVSGALGGSTQEAIVRVLGNKKEYYENMKAQLFSFHDVALQEMQDRQQAEFDAEQSHFERMRQSLFAYHDGRLQVMQAQNQLEVEAELEKMALQEDISKRWLSVQQNIWNTMLALAWDKSKALFGIMKAAEIAKAIAATHSAAAQALAVPPAPNYPLSAMALKAGYVEVAAIAATTVGKMALGAGGGGSGGGGSGGGGSTALSYSAPEIPVAEEKKGDLIIHVEGDFLGDEYYLERLAEKISEAVEEREVRLVASNAKQAEALA